MMLPTSEEIRNAWQGITADGTKITYLATLVLMDPMLRKIVDHSSIAGAAIFLNEEADSGVCADFVASLIATGLDCAFRIAEARRNAMKDPRTIQQLIAHLKSGCPDHTAEENSASIRVLEWVLGLDDGRRNKSVQ